MFGINSLFASQQPYQPHSSNAFYGSLSGGGYQAPQYNAPSFNLFQFSLFNTLKNTQQGFNGQQFFGGGFNGGGLGGFGGLGNLLGSLIGMIQLLGSLLQLQPQPEASTNNNNADANNANAGNAGNTTTQNNDNGNAGNAGTTDNTNTTTNNYPPAYEPPQTDYPTHNCPNQPPVEEPPVEEPPVEEPPVEEPPVEEPPVEEPPVEEPPVEEPPVEEPPVEEPPVEEPPVEEPPVEEPPVEEPPVETPTNFVPGSLSIDDVPRDANGNIDAAWLADVLKPSGNVDTRLLDNSDPSGMSDFARQGIRMLGHDMYDGQVNGDVVLRTLLNPEGSGNTAFTGNENQINIIKEWGRRDLTDDGVINGSVYGKLIQDVWPTTDGVAIPGFANELQYKAANLNAEELFKDTFDVTTPAGLMGFSQASGITPVELLNFSLWGHRIMDRSFTTKQIADEALNDPTSIDFGFTHAMPQTLAYVEGLSNDPNAKTTMALGVLNLLRKHL